MTQLEIPTHPTPAVDPDFIAAFARLSPDLAYSHLRQEKRTVREAVTILIDAVMCQNFMALHEHLEYCGNMPYLNIEFFGQEIRVEEYAQGDGTIRQIVGDEETQFLSLGEEYTYEPKTMKKIRKRAIDLLFALATIGEQKQAARDKKQRAGSDLPF